MSSTPKQMQLHYKFSKIEKNGIIGITFFFLQNHLSPVDSGRKILKHRLSSRGVVSPNQRCRQRNNCLRGLNEDKGFFSKLIFVTMQKEG